RSAEVLTVVLTDELLLARLGSGVLLLTEAVLVIVPAEVLELMVTTRVNLSVLPVPTVPPVGVPVTVPADWAYVKPSGFMPLTAVADTNVVPVGTMSVSDTPAAALGPLLVSVIV